MADLTPLDPGLRAPDFVLPAVADNRHTRFYGAMGGAPAVVLFTRGRVAVHTIADGQVDPTPALDVIDADGAVATQYGATSGVAIVLDANLRCLASLVPDQASTHLAPSDALCDDALTQAIVSVAARQHVAGDQVVSAQAPVLLIPNVLTPGRCDWLRQMWADGGAAETGVETTEEDTRAEVLNAKRKRRRDLVVEDGQTTAVIARIVGQAVMPEVRRAFAYRATRFEGFKIGNYNEDSQGFFSAHRDNLSPATIHRRFALSLNLNDDYDGGEVRFPEFGGQRYRPPTGGALVFAGSLLHEVLPVTRGERFVLLSFLYGDDVTRAATA